MKGAAVKRNRITEWWRPKAGTIFSLLLFYLAFWEVPFELGWKLLLFSTITLSGFGVTGYFLNDWADIPYDRKAGKTNLADGIPLAVRFVLLLGLLVIALAPWVVYFESDTLCLGLISLQLLLQFIYPMPPVRLKNLPLAAIVVDALYAFVIPSLLAWHAFDVTAGYSLNNSHLHFVFLGLWMLAIGIRQIVNHHVIDSFNDKISDTPNVTNKYDAKTLRSFIQRVVFPIELTSGGAFFFTLHNGDSYLPLIAIALIIVFVLPTLKKKPPFFSVSFSGAHADRFSSFYLGLLGLGALVFVDVRYSFVFLVFVLLFTDVLLHPIVNHLFSRVRYLPWKAASLSVNWSIYYLRKYLLRWSEERNYGVHYPDYLARLEMQNRAKNGTVAVFNQNHSKYTETFVRGHVENLPYEVLFFHGWPHPTNVGDNDNLLGSNQFLRRLKRNLIHFSNRNYEEIVNVLISKRLIDGEVDLILAEFGTMGARVVTIAEQIGIPIVPIFYGYDAWHSKAIEENHDGYKALFQSAPLILGVSKDICNQLIRLGCDADKVEYLPCYLDLSQFKYVERGFSEPNFLAIGRFCATKAPFLTILAFSKVVKQIPDAKLTMIGADENGVLETCMTLIRSLSLEDNVVLPGALTPKEVHEQMAKASIFVQHSLTTPQSGDKEGTPVAIMEAMATGLPVISTNHAGIAEIIENGVSGILVDEFDSETMSEEMIRLFNNKQEIRQMSKSATEAIFKNNLLTDHIKILSSKLEKHIKR